MLLHYPSPAAAAPTCFGAYRSRDWSLAVATAPVAAARKLTGVPGDAGLTLGVETADGKDGADCTDDADGDAGGVGRRGAEVTWTMVAAPVANVGGADTETERGGSSSPSPVPVRDTSCVVTVCIQRHVPSNAFSWKTLGS